MKKRFISALLSVAMVSALFTGCGGGDSSTTSDAAETGDETANTSTSEGEETGDETADASTSEDEEREPVTITFGGWGDYFLLREQCDKFEEKYPWITVDVVKPVGQDWYAQDLMTLAATNEMPDVFNIENLPVAMQNEWCLDITDYFENDEESSSYPEWLLEYCKSDDRLYTLVSTMYVDLVQVNKGLLEDNNMEIPSYDWTIDDWKEILRGTTVSGESIGTGDLDGYLQWMPAQFGNEDIGYYSYNTKTKQFEFGTEFIETVNILKEMYDDSVSLNDILDVEFGLAGSGADDEENEKINTEKNNYCMENYGIDGAFWLKGKYGLTTNASWALNWETYNADIYTGFDWDIYPFPVKNEGDQARTCILNEFLAVSAATEHPYESYLLMKYMSYDLDGFEAKVDFMSTYDKETYMEKYAEYDPTSFATTLHIYQIPPSTDKRAVELYERINPNLDKEGLTLIFDRMNEGGFLNGVRVIPGMSEVSSLVSKTITTEVFTGKKTASDIAAELEKQCNDIVNSKRAEYGLN